MLSPYEKKRLKQFYSRAPRCQMLQKTSSWRFSSWICGKVGKPCGPRVCPMEDPMEDLQSEKPEVPQVPEVDSLPHVKHTEVMPEIDVIKLHPEKALELNVIHRQRAKTHCGPHVKSGTIVKRVLISFKSKTGEVQRWPFDCVFSPRRKPRILEFQAKIRRRNMKNARFYFPVAATSQDVKNLVGSWFSQLGAHDPDARVNLMGPPVPYFIDVEEE